MWTQKIETAPRRESPVSVTLELKTIGVSIALLSLGVLAVAIALISSAPAFSQAVNAPDWAAIFDTEGRLLDAVDAAGDPYPDGVPDVVDLYDADDYVAVLDNLSDGVAIDMSILTDEQVVDNGTVSAPRDIGNSYLLATRDAAGNRVIHAGIERLASKAGGWIELQLFQDKVQVTQGKPWPIHGATKDGDLAIRMRLKGGQVSSIDAWAWQGDDYSDLSSVTISNGCGGQAGVLSACSGFPPIEGSQVELRDGDGNLVDVQAEDFIDLMVNTGALTGNNAEYSSIQVRTSEDIALGSFVAIGAWSQAASE